MTLLENKPWRAGNKYDFRQTIRHKAVCFRNLNVFVLYQTTSLLWCFFKEINMTKTIISDTTAWHKATTTSWKQPLSCNCRSNTTGSCSAFQLNLKCMTVALMFECLADSFLYSWLLCTTHLNLFMMERIIAYRLAY